MLKKMHAQIFIGIFLGILFGLIFHENALILSPIADIFLRLLKMVVIPLVFTVIIVGLANMGDMQKLGKIGLRMGICFIGTTFIAVILGVFLALVFNPGLNSSLQPESVLSTVEIGKPAFFGVFLAEIVPDNIVNSIAIGNILPVIFFAFILGIALVAIGDKGKPIIQMFTSLNEAILKIVDWIMKLAPIGIFALIAVMVGRTGLSVFEPLLFYLFVVLVGLMLHGTIILPLILIVFGKYSPLSLVKHMSSALAMAFSSNSSIATLPITMDCLKKKARISERIVSFVCPLGVTVNMDGTAMYQAIAAIFIAQVYGIKLTFIHIGIIILTSTLASIGTAAIPSAGLITMAIVLNAVGLPVEGIGFILAVDRFLDMFRTTINVFTDGVASVVVARYEG